MKTIILAGGFGTRISEESHLKPKPIIEIGGKPILWHIMKIYSHYGITDFVICCGYMGYVIKEYFANYFLHMSDVTIDMKDNSVTVHQKNAEPWKVTVVDTGLETMTGGRLKRVEKYIDGPFCLTYGDGVSDINIENLLEFHNAQNCLITVTAIQPIGRFGSLDISGARVKSFQEKPKGDNRWVSGGFFVCEPEILSYIENDQTILEKEPLEKLANENQLSVFKHTGFWSAMDTLRDKIYLDDLWKNNNASWKVWE
jgi:glucose-1-phosphate cytidylyltransferase